MAAPEVRAAGWSPEAALLAACARVVLDEEAADEIRRGIEYGIRWDRLVRMAAHQAVVPLLYHQLHRTVPQKVPTEILAELRHEALAATAQNLFLVRALAGLLELFQRQGIRAIPYKGPVVAATAYGHLSLRQIGDLDLLVHPCDELAARNLLLAQGYRLMPDLELAWESAFKSPDGRIEVDLHWALLPARLGVELDFDPLWDRCTPIDLAGIQVPNLAPEDGLIVLCLQLFKDTLNGKLTLRQVCDIAEMIRANPPLDWYLLLRRATQERIRREVELGLRVAQETLGAVVPDAVRGVIETDTSPLPFIGEATRVVFASSRPRDHVLFQVVHEHKRLAQWKRGLDDKLKAMLSGIVRLGLMGTRPTDQERELVPLPLSWSWLYYLIRPIRLSANFLLKPLRHRLARLR